MAFVFELPEVGEGVVEAEVVHWSVQVGDIVAVDQPLCEITTDKAQLEISSPRAGRIVALHGEPGDIIKVNAPLVTIDESAAASANGPTSQPAPASPPAPASQATPSNGAPVPPRPQAVPPPVAAPAPQPVAAQPGVTKATPAVRRHAREAGVDIHQVPGTGPGGRVTHDDLRSFQEPAVQEPGALPKAPPALPQAQVVPSGQEERIKIIGIRRKIAEQMRLAKHTAPHFTYVEEVEATRLVALRESLKPLAQARGVKLTYLPLIMKATSIVLRDFPNINAVMDEQAFELVVKGDHNFGVACDTPNGLTVPVIQSVDQKSVIEIAAELEEVTGRCRAGKARVEDFRGGTFTFTSVGNIGGVLATPILNVPEVAILGVNAIRDAAVVRDGQVVARKMFYLSPSFDHRIIDGAVAARFVAALKALIERPEALLLELR